MNAFARIVIGFRIPIIIVVLAASAVLGASLPSLRQDEDVLRFLPSGDPDIRLFRRVSEEFGGLDVAVIGVESPRLFTADGISAVRAMTRAAHSVPGVYHTLSFTEMPHLVATEELFQIFPLVPEVIPTDRAGIDEIRRTALGDDLVAGRLVSPDGRAALVLCFLVPDAPMVEVARGIRRAVPPHAGRMRLYFGGLPFIQEHIGDGTRADVRALTPWVLLLSALSTFVFFRRFLGALLVMSSVALGAVWTIGGMAALGVPMTLVGTSLPIVLVAVGGAYGAHVLAAFYVASAPTAQERVTLALRDVFAPVAMSTLTTVAGFASFLVMDIEPMRDFGVQASLGVLTCALVSLTFIPAVLSFGRGGGAPPPAKRLAGPLWRYASAAGRRRWLTLGLVGAAAAAAAAATATLAADTTMDSFFRPESEPSRAERFLRERFGGSLFVQVLLRGDLRDPVVLEELRRVVEEARAIDGVARVDSFLDTLEKLAAGLGGMPRLPRTPGQVAGLQSFMAGNPALRQSVDDSMSRALVKITLSTRDTRVTDGVIDQLQTFLRDEVPGRVVPVDVRGEGARVDAARVRRLAMVAARVDRLLRGAGQRPRGDAAARVEGLLRRRFGRWTLEPGPDLDAAVTDAVAGYFDSVDSPFAPFDARPLGPGLSAAARHPLPPARLARELATPLLPPEVASDREGIDLALPVLAERISEARARVLAARLLPDVLAAAGVERPGGDVEAQVRRALEELDDPRVGLAVDGSGAREASDELRIETGVTGAAVINRSFRQSTERNFGFSLATSLASMLVLGVLMFWRFGVGLTAVAPSAVTLLLTLGLMGLTRTPIDPGTCMLASLSLGIGIDYAIHFLWRRRWRGLSMEATCRTVGPSIVFNAVEVASCFAVLFAASMVPLSRFGLLLTMAMLVAAAATFTLLPALAPAAALAGKGPQGSGAAEEASR